MNKRALFCVDPGGSSGVAWAVVDIDAPTVREAMVTRQFSGSVTVDGRDELIHINKIVSHFAQWVKLIDIGTADEIAHVDLCIEDWQPHGARSKEGSSPARIGWGLVGWLHGLGWGSDINVVWIQPSAQRHATQARLRPMEAWIVGKGHERAAHALMVERLHKLMGS